MEFKSPTPIKAAAPSGGIPVALPTVVAEDIPKLGKKVIIIQDDKRVNVPDIGNIAVLSIGDTEAAAPTIETASVSIEESRNKDNSKQLWRIIMDLTSSPEIHVVVVLRSAQLLSVVAHLREKLPNKDKIAPRIVLIQSGTPATDADLDQVWKLAEFLWERDHPAHVVPTSEVGDDAEEILYEVRCCVILLSGFGIPEFSLRCLIQGEEVGKSFGDDGAKEIGEVRNRQRFTAVGAKFQQSFRSDFLRDTEASFTLKVYICREPFDFVPLRTPTGSEAPSEEEEYDEEEKSDIPKKKRKRDRDDVYSDSDEGEKVVPEAKAARNADEDTPRSFWHWSCSIM
jgi:hypothetical protein